MYADTVVVDVESMEWRPHPRFDGVEVKMVHGGLRSDEFSQMLVRLEPNGGAIPPHTHDGLEERHPTRRDAPGTPSSRIDTGTLLQVGDLEGVPDEAQRVVPLQRELGPDRSDDPTLSLHLDEEHAGEMA